MTPAPRLSLTLAIHPNARGFGWVAFSGALSPHDWGVSHAFRGGKNEYCLSRIEKLLLRLTPEVIVLEAYDEGSSRRSARVSRLCRSIASLAANHGISVSVYTRGDVRACFASVGAKTRDEIAAAVARHIEVLRHRLPAKRLAWTSETLPLALFSAAALCLTHYQLGASTLFDTLRD
jgi:Holliday junction resolvasome RuvABC endonuclease subunit